MTTRPLQRRRFSIAIALPMLACHASACRGDQAPTSREGVDADVDVGVGVDEDEAKALRIASVTVFSDEVLWELGPEARSRVVAVSSMADDARYSKVASKWSPKLPRVTGVSEQVLAVRPDRAVVASFTAAETLTALRAAGVDLLVLEHFRGFADYRANVQAVARAVGSPEAAKPLLEHFEARRQTLAQAPPPTPITVVSWSDGSVPGAQTSFDDVTSLIGLTNVASQHGRQGHSRVSAETLVTWAPQWVVVPCAPPGDDAGCDAARAAARTDPAIAATIAAAHTDIVAVPSNELFDVGEGMLDLAQRLTAELRPGDPSP